MTKTHHPTPIPIYLPRSTVIHVDYVQLRLLPFTIHSNDDGVVTDISSALPVNKSQVVSRFMIEHPNQTIPPCVSLKFVLVLFKFSIDLKYNRTYLDFGRYSVDDIYVDICQDGHLVCCP